MASREFLVYEGDYIVGEGTAWEDGRTAVLWGDGGVLVTTIAELTSDPYHPVVYRESQFWVDLRRDLEQDAEFRKSFVLDAVRLAIAQLGSAVAAEVREREAAYMAAVADYGTGRADGHADGGFVKSEVDADTPPAILIPHGRHVLPHDSAAEDVSLEMALHGDAYVAAPPGPDEKILQGKAEDGCNGC